MTHKATFTTYAIGFGSSLLLTAFSFFLVAKHVSSGGTFLPHLSIALFLLGLAAVQFVVQLAYFLHLGRGKEQRMTMGIFVSTLATVLIIVFGSIWIMSNLNYNMTPQQTDTYMHEQG